MREDNDNDELREQIEDLIKRYMERQRGQIYCQRCEEPRSVQEFIPGAPRGVCVHCLKSMDPREARWLAEQRRVL